MRLFKTRDLGHLGPEGLRITGRCDLAVKVDGAYFHTLEGVPCSSTSRTATPPTRCSSLRASDYETLLCSTSRQEGAQTLPDLICLLAAGVRVDLQALERALEMHPAVLAAACCLQPSAEGGRLCCC